MLWSKKTKTINRITLQQNAGFDWQVTLFFFPATDIPT